MEMQINDKYTRFLEKIEKIDTDLMSMIADSSETQIFNSMPIKDLIEYQWGATGFDFHIVGFVNFFLYMLVLIVYIW